jgi:hypothetical protein
MAMIDIYFAAMAVANSNTRPTVGKSSPAIPKMEFIHSKTACG